MPYIPHSLIGSRLRKWQTLKIQKRQEGCHFHNQKRGGGGGGGGEGMAHHGKVGSWVGLRKKTKEGGV